ncbi:aminoglycoside phosphotransferase family protein [Gramella sp. AN32]|uniref:Phosphotransferase enzyme family protein n=1 Tax=Christiangramia antarctica TaxID=2058158 RepID=A0ABW5X2F9_9FLAO|nr:aminoglycoside phosphotransferase family protein [Gramella sp. AN32]MCM4156694.1 aminoglycoside phosphotransferase family protein [Gramella sp. AN32]
MHSVKELNRIIAHFNISEKAYDFSLLNNGLINDTYLVTSALNPQYILQRVNHEVFKDVPGLMHNIKLVLPNLADSDYAQIHFITSNSGKNYLGLDHEYWRLMTYIEDSITYNKTTSEKLSKEAGRIIGKFHSLLKNEEISTYVETIPKFHDLQKRKLEFEQALKNTDQERLMIAKNAITLAYQFLEELYELETFNLPQRICHNDTKLNNILFSTENDRALCLIDLDTVMSGYFFYDFGDAVRTIANTAAEDEQDHHKITFENNLFEAFIEGLKIHSSFLTPEEKKSLALGAVFMPFLHGLRALTDYLNKNIYYKVTHEKQNLDRCLSLFDFAHKALQKKEYMQSVIQAKLK